MIAFGKKHYWIICLLCLFGSIFYYFLLYDESDWYSLSYEEDVSEYHSNWALESGIEDNPVIKLSWEEDVSIYSGHGGQNKMYWWSKNITAKNPLNHRVYFHTLWKFLHGYTDDMEIPSHIYLIMNSFLATQDLNNTILIFWTNFDIRNHKKLKEYFDLPYVTTKIYDPWELSEGSPVAGMSKILGQKDEIVYSDGDLFRLLAIYRYGGVYFDCDTLLLRDFTPLLSQQFLYQWDTYVMNKALMNGAVMHSFPKSKWIYLLLKELPNMCVGDVCWGKELYKRVYYKHRPNHTIFPCFMFDPDWYRFDNYGELPKDTYAFSFFEQRRETPSYSLDDLYDGVFAYHWHGRWKIPVESGSKRDQIGQLQLKEIRRRLPGFNPQEEKTVLFGNPPVSSSATSWLLPVFVALLGLRCNL